ncbi:Transcriptional regulator, TetR family [Frankia canadensis]|uniref:Transcriptional regulator, TetR family n=1 Tax=Frankia canadensis TaxID=1836972 RepID=A0A2I2L168_9ACTN|nr:TetR/AcrR family transcriptional regulator [Frankia canadensis]SNQ51673.1 Transcriptional regulator, TetR family [Frankia canadensis]SOU58963.1 Transcriptional regulator, TetR family [Frankia canadensis]
MFSGPPSTRTRRPAAETRQAILDAAENLFYWHGITATGVDRVAAVAGVGPTTLYRLFGSKDALVAAYVDRYAAGYREWIESLTADESRPARERILALFDGLVTVTGPDAFRGCLFLMVLAEYPDPTSAAHASAQAVKAWVRTRLRDLALELPGRDAAAAEATSDRLALVIEGLYASTAALGTEGPARSAQELAILIIDAH